MFLVIDIGNTLKKAAVFNTDEALVKMVLWTSWENLQSFIEEYPISACIVSSVREDAHTLVGELNNLFHTILFTSKTPLPITLRYDTPETIGTDRIANAVGANTLFPGEAVLAIQAGTCLVADIVNENGEYLGGSIAPGLQMRFACLAEKTARLPHVQPAPNPPITGTSTETSILSGVMHGIQFEIEGMINHYQTLFPNLKTILTGGDAPLLKKLIKNRIFAAPSLVLIGLHKILKYNASNL